MRIKFPRSRISRRDMMKTTGVAAAGLAAASAFPAPYVRAQGTKTLRFLNGETSRESIQALERIFAEYEEQTGTRIVIDSVPLSDAFTKITTSLRGGQPYDIGTLAFIGHVLLLQGEGHLVPLTELTNKHEWGPNILFPMEGEVYWYPYDYNLAWIYYRKDLYEQKGLEVPQTWDAMLRNSQALNGDDMAGSLFPISSDGATNWLSTAFMWAEGVSIFDGNWNIVFDGPEMAPKVERYLDFFAQLYETMPPGASQASYGEVLSNFTAGLVGHSAYAGRLIESLERNAPQLTDKFGITPYMDSKGEQKAVNHGYDGWVVLNTENAEESMKFMEWFTENRYIDFLHTAPLHFQPPRLDIYEEERWRANPLIQKYPDVVGTMRGFITDPEMVVTSIDTQGPVPDLRPGKIFQAFIIPEMLQNRILKDMPAAEAVEIAGNRMREAIAQ